MVEFGERVVDFDARPVTAPVFAPATHEGEVMQEAMGQFAVKEPVVRCRDCRHYDHGDAGCMLWVLAENGLLHINDPDGYCKWGERKQAEQCEEGI